MKIKLLTAGNKVWAHYHGKIYNFSTNTSSETHGEEAASEGESLTAPFPCKILKLHVKKGDTVQTGDPIIAVEAMKMEYVYSSPKNGKIAAVLVKEGSVVPEGTQFVEWEEK